MKNRKELQEAFMAGRSKGISMVYSIVAEKRDPEPGFDEWYKKHKRKKKTK